MDSCSIIYHVEAIEPYHAASRPLWEALDTGRVGMITSELSLLEVLVKPVRDGNQALITAFRHVLLYSLGVTCLPIGREVLERAAELRALYALRTPDSIHAASALQSGCTLFVTNDAAFRRVPGLNVAVLGEVAAS